MFRFYRRLGRSIRLVAEGLNVARDAFLKGQRTLKRRTAAQTAVAIDGADILAK
jgi:hypothetical protein